MGVFMEQKEYTQSVSKFLLPFYFETENSNDYPFEKADFTRYQVMTRYLVKSVYELFNGEDASCKCFYLNDEVRVKYELPQRYSVVNMHSDMIGCKGDFQYKLGSIRMIYFTSGIGFLETEIQYLADDVKAITDIGYCIANIFTNEHDNGPKPNNLRFSYCDNENGTQVLFSLKNSLLALLNAEKNAKKLTIFPSSERKRMLVYHAIICPDIHESNKCLHALSNGLHSGIYFDDNMDNYETFSSVAGQKWAVSSSGVASLALTNDDNMHSDFLKKSFRKNTIYDYFYIFVFLIHEREILLLYNYQAVKNRDNSKKLIGMKNDLLRLQIQYTYNTVSTEAAYQKFYMNLAEEFNISSLEEDIRGVVENVENYVNDNKDRKTNTLLTAISVLAVFSVLTDGVAFADRIQDGGTFGILQWSVICIVGLFILISILLLKKK